MQSFEYSAKDAKGDIVRGSVTAANLQAARQQILQQGFFPITVAPAGEKKSLGASVLSAKRIKLRDLALFTWQFASMIDAGIQVIAALNALQEQTSSKVLQVVLTDVIADLQSGSSLNKALRKHPNVFQTRYCSMVEAGELSGTLSTVLERLSKSLDQEIELRQKVASAMVYPIVVMVVAVICLFILLIFVIPIFSDVYKNFGATLPLPTLMLINVSGVTQKYSYIIVPVLVGGVVAFNSFRKSKTGKPIVDRYMLKLPLFGNLFNKVAVARAVRTLSEMLNAGIGVMQALEQAAETSGNAVVEEALKSIIPDVAKGRNLAPLLRQTRVVPAIVVHMVAAGEETGQIDQMLAKVADFYDRDIDYTIKSMLGMLEPLLTLGLGVVVAFIAIAIYMPIFNLAQVLK